MNVSHSDYVRFLILTLLKKEDDNFIYSATLKSLTELINPGRIVILTLPGAFTPTCTNSHLPAFEKNYDLIKSYAIDEVYILSSNDFYAAKEWFASMSIEKCNYISDSDLIFGKKYNNLLYRENLGIRNKREIFIFNKSVLEKRFSEVYSSDTDDPFEETQCEKLLEYLQSVNGN